jgi:hypothetical protein
MDRNKAGRTRNEDEMTELRISASKFKDEEKRNIGILK